MKSRERQGPTKVKIHGRGKALEELESTELRREAGVLGVTGEPRRRRGLHLLVLPAAAAYGDVA